MKHLLKYCFLVVAPMSACGGIPDAAVAEDNTEVEPVAAAESALDECLLIDAHKSYSAKLLGGDGNDHYPVNGKTITRVKLDHSAKATGPFGIGGNGNANIAQQDSTEVVVHYWYDLYTDFDYDIKVWVEC